MEKLIKVDSKWVGNKAGEDNKIPAVIITYVGTTKCKFRTIVGKTKEVTMRKSDFVLDYKPLDLVHYKYLAVGESCKTPSKIGLELQEVNTVLLDNDIEYPEQNLIARGKEAIKKWEEGDKTNLYSEIVKGAVWVSKKNPLIVLAITDIMPDAEFLGGRLNDEDDNHCFVTMLFKNLISDYEPLMAAPSTIESEKESHKPLAEDKLHKLDCNLDKAIMSASKRNNEKIHDMLWGTSSVNPNGIFEHIEENVLLKDMRKTFEDCMKTAIAKNSDYGGSNDDPYANFRNSTIAGVPVEKGIMVRMMDKISRISTLMEKEAQVKDEAIEDTLMDLINYAAILKSYLKNK